jgi:dihydrofolate reductase
MIVSQIAAMSKNRVIGSKLKLPWHIPEDLKFFKETTKGHIIIHGRKTYESLGYKPLPNRLNIIITRNPESIPYHKDIVVFTDLKEALDFAATKTSEWGDEVFIGGGEEIYRLAMPFTDRIYLTLIDKEFEGDARFPEFDQSVFKEVHRDDRDGPIPFSFITYERKP